MLSTITWLSSRRSATSTAASLQLLARVLQALGEVGAEQRHGGAGDAEHEDRVEEGARRQVEHVRAAPAGESTPERTASSSPP